MKKIKFFADYAFGNSLKRRVINNYGNNNDGYKITIGNDYDVAVIFNYSDDYIRPNAYKICILQEPSWSPTAKLIDKNEPDITILHDKSLIEGNNVLELPSIMFHHDNSVSYDYLLESKLKNKKISFIVSNLNYSEGHKERMILLDKILNSDLEIDIYGYGHDILDSRYKGSLINKFDGIKNYEYSIGIENSCEKNYVTEKFIDIIINDAVPIYHGCPNISTIYNEKGFINLNLNDPIKQLIEINTENYSTYLPFTIENKLKYMKEFNLLKIIKKIIEN